MHKHLIPGSLTTTMLVACPLLALASGDSGQAGGMSLWQALFLGFVEGMTEYLPVSSTGHLLLAQQAMGMNTPQAKEAADAYAICIQAGAILAVLGLYAGRVRQMAEGLLGRNPAGLTMAGNIIAGFLPAVVIGLLFGKLIKHYLFGIWPVVAAWLVGGIAILFLGRTVEQRSGRGHGTEHVLDHPDQRPAVKGARTGGALETLTLRMALLIGCIQCIAMWPGMSRSLVTILGGLLVGLSVPAAVEFSFLLGLVTLTAATAHDALKHGQAMLALYDPIALAAGLVSALIFAVISIKWMVAYLSRHSLNIFGYYRIMLALAVAGLLLTGRL